MNSPYFLEIVEENVDIIKREIELIFEYPEISMRKRKEKIKEREGWVKLLEEILVALNILESYNMSHGKISPDYIYFNERKQCYQLIDRLSELDEEYFDDWDIVNF